MKKMTKIMAVLLVGIMILSMIPASAAIRQCFCYIGSTGYVTLAEAVAAAQPGDVLWMYGDDNTTKNITIDKSITIELQGYELANACIKFKGDIEVKINDRVGTAVLNSNHNIGYTIEDDFSHDSRPRASFYLTGGADVIISGVTNGTQFHGGTESGTLPKAFVVGKNCSLTVNGGTMVYHGGAGSDGIFVCDTGILTLNDIYITRYTPETSGSSLSYANVPTTENPLTIKKGHFIGGMWVEGRATINGVSISYGHLSFEKIEKALLYTSEGSYIDYDKSTNTNGWEIFIASNTLSTDTEMDNVEDATEALHVSAGGDVTAKEGQKVIFQPQVTGGDGVSAITYSWIKDGVDTGITDSTYSLEAVAKSDAGEYVFTATQGEATVSCTFNLIVELETPVVPEEPEVPTEPEEFNFTSIRTENGKNISVDHENKKISVDVEEGDHLVLYVHQKDAIPGGQIKMKSYNGNKVEYHSTGVYRIYSVEQKEVTVSSNITVGEKTENYEITVNFVNYEDVLFRSIRTGNGENIRVDHENKKIYVDVAEGSDNLVLYVHQKDVIPGGQIRMNSYNGNKVTYDASGVYRIYTLGGNPITVSAKVTIDGVTYIYDIDVNFDTDAPAFDFTEIKCDNDKSMEIDHDAQTIRIYAEENATDVTLYKKQYNEIKGTLALTSFMGNRVQSNQTEGTYKVCFVKNKEVSVKGNFTVNDIVKEYVITVVFTPEWTFETLKADGVSSVTVDHDAKVVTMKADSSSVLLYIDQANDAQVWMKSYNGNKVVYNSADRTYTIERGATDGLTVQVKITINGETRYYDLAVNF